MADEEPQDEERPRKGAPPGVRIRASKQGAKAVAPTRSLETRPLAEPDKTPPPLADGASLSPEGPKVGALASPAPSSAGAPSLATKPPPPHVQRGGPARHVEAPKDEPSAAKPEGPAPVKVSIKDTRARPPAPAPDRPATGPSPPSTPSQGRIETPGPPAGAPATPAAAPHISTDEGRLSALWAAILLVALVFTVELYAGFLSNSLALFSDAGHVFMDLFSYGVAYAAVTMSKRRSSERETFGAHRAEIVAALMSGLLLLLVVAAIYFEAIGRLANPEPTDLTLMVSVPLLSVAANFYLARRFRGAHDLNMRGARLHVLSDLLSGLGVLVGGVLILATGNYIFDPIVSLFIGLLILRGAIQLVRDSLEILLERTPAHIEVPKLLESLKALPGAVGVHSVHVWSLCSSVHALSAHLVAAPGARADLQGLLSAAHDMVEKDFAIHFTTIQVEAEDCGAEQHPTAAHGVSEAISHAHSHA